MDFVKRLIDIDELERISVGDKTGFKHRRHRFVLPLLLHAQREGVLPQPCTLICFDRHHDCLPPREIEKTREIDIASISMFDFTVFCERDLSPRNDEWIIAGIELGMIQDVIVIGVDDIHCAAAENGKYPPGSDSYSRVVFKTGHLGHMLEYQGHLADHASSRSHADFWDILGWRFEQGIKYWFNDERPPFLLDIDLDCFSFELASGEFTIPWPDEVYEKWYLAETDYGMTYKTTGKDVFQGLVERSGLITIATEPGCCGSKEKSEQILNDVNRILLDGTLEVHELKPIQG